VIVRQTLGWQSGKGRKQRDWMTQKQLIKRTGRASAALSAALDVLVRENLVECRDSKDEVLLSLHQRRNHCGRVYFSLAPRLLQQPKRSAKANKGNHIAPANFSSEGAIRIFSGWAKTGAVAGKRCGATDEGQPAP